jgi:glycosyltransferase involved in cell wall biosynthesis
MVKENSYSNYNIDGTSTKSVLFLTPYPYDTAPGQRFRYEQYLGILHENGIEYTLDSFMDNGTWEILYKKGLIVRKAWGILRGFLHRFLKLPFLVKYDFVFIFREASPVGPPIFEWIISKVFRKKIIYDFDDAIWLPNTSDNNRIVAGIKWHSKVASICRWSYKVSCGNSYLADYARQFNKNVIVNPTTIDTVHYHNRIKDQHTPMLTIGWTGTHSTIQYLDAIVPILQRLEQRYDFIFTVISNAPPAFNLKSLRYVKWSKETEIDDLMDFNIGIMPLTDDPWARGKCGFKALQYMSLGIPALVSPIGVNTSIVDDGANGMICSSDSDWEKAITRLITDRGLSIRLGNEARKKVEKKYSVISNAQNFLNLFD